MTRTDGSYRGKTDAAGSDPGLSYALVNLSDCALDVCTLVDACGLGVVVDDVQPAVHATRITTAHNVAIRYVDDILIVTSDLERFNGHTRIKALRFALQSECIWTLLVIT
jgi:hypothetical protein